MKKIFGSLLLLGLSLSLYACGSNNNNSDSKDSSKKLFGQAGLGRKIAPKQQLRK